MRHLVRWSLAEKNPTVKKSLLTLNDRYLDLFFCLKLTLCTNACKLNNDSRWVFRVLTLSVLKIVVVWFFRVHLSKVKTDLLLVWENILASHDIQQVALKVVMLFILKMYSFLILTKNLIFIDSQFSRKFLPFMNGAEKMHLQFWFIWGKKITFPLNFFPKKCAYAHQISHVIIFFFLWQKKRFSFHVMFGA